jgi:hypothetical protein
MFLLRVYLLYIPMKFEVFQKSKHIYNFSFFLVMHTHSSAAKDIHMYPPSCLVDLFTDSAKIEPCQNHRIKIIKKCVKQHCRSRLNPVNTTSMG